MLYKFAIVIAQLFPQPDHLPKVDATDAKLKAIINIIFSILGATALLIITIAGFRFVIHQGDPQEVTKQRNSIIYAFIGLVVALASWGIVNLVISKL
jgi:uncharacterized membrane protein YidH (DUF202 family)